MSGSGADAGEGVLELDQLLAPLGAGDKGEGVDLREDYSAASPYQKLRDARNDARAEERAQDAAGGDVAVPQPWRDVKRVATQSLAKSSKDFEIACWLAESAVRLDGLAGLTDASLLLDAMIEQYWDNGFPRPDEEDGMEVRTIPLGGLAGDSADGMLMQPLRRLPLFTRADGSPASLYVWGQAEAAAAVTDAAKRAARIAAGAPELEALENEARAGAPVLRGVGLAAQRAHAAWTAFAERMDAVLGSDSPPTRRVTEALDQMVALAERFAGPLRAAAAAAAAEPAAAAGEVAVAATGGGSVAAGPAGAPAPLRTREDAIKRLSELADFFRSTEPHSPLAYTLDDAVRRARLTLPELLAEILPNSAARNGMLLTLGIRVAAEDMGGALSAAPVSSNPAAVPVSPPPPPPEAAPSPPPPPASKYSDW